MKARAKAARILLYGVCMSLQLSMYVADGKEIHLVLALILIALGVLARPREGEKPVRLPRSWWFGFIFPLAAGNLFYRAALLVNCLSGERISDAVVGWSAVAFTACASAMLTRAARPCGER